MKTISGNLVSVQPISLSKAARYISDFSSFENNGADEVVSKYLNRASEAFNSLVQLHKDLKHPQSSHKKQRKKRHSDIENGVSLRNDETMSYDNGERVDGVTKEEDGSVRVGGMQDMGTSKKRKKGDEKESVSVEDGISGELRKGSENGGGNVEVENMVNGVVDQTKQKKKKKKKSKKKKNEITEEGSKMEGSVDVESRGGENGRGLGTEKEERKGEEKKKKKKRKENETMDMEKKVEMKVEQGKENMANEETKMKELGKEVKSDVGKEESKKKKRKSVDIDDESKENFVEPTKKKRKKSNVSDD